MSLCCVVGCKGRAGELGLTLDLQAVDLCRQHAAEWRENERRKERARVLRQCAEDYERGLTKLEILR